MSLPLLNETIVSSATQLDALPIGARGKDCDGYPIIKIGLHEWALVEGSGSGHWSTFDTDELLGRYGDPGGESKFLPLTITGGDR